MGKQLPSPAQAAEYWARGLNGATQKISDGIDRVTEAPGAKAAQQADVWAQNTVASKQKFINNSRRVSLGEWQTATKAAVGNVGAGATRNQSKFEQRITPVLNHIAVGVQRLPARGNYEQNKMRAVAMMDHMHNYSPPAGS